MPGVPRIFPKGKTNFSKNTAKVPSLGQGGSGGYVRPNKIEPGLKKSFNLRDFEKITKPSIDFNRPPKNSTFLKTTAPPLQKNKVVKKKAASIPQAPKEAPLEEPAWVTILDVGGYVLKGFWVGSFMFVAWTGQKLRQATKEKSPEPESKWQDDDSWGWPAPDRRDVNKDYQPGNLDPKYTLDEFSKGRFDVLKKTLASIGNFLNQIFEMIGKGIRLGPFTWIQGLHRKWSHRKPGPFLMIFPPNGSSGKPSQNKENAKRIQSQMTSGDVTHRLAEAAKSQHFALQSLKSLAELPHPKNTDVSQLPQNIRAILHLVQLGDSGHREAGQVLERLEIRSLGWAAKRGDGFAVGALKILAHRGNRSAKQKLKQLKLKN